jgi:uncharacterized protein (DUF697 family)/predicted GTPase
MFESIKNFLWPGNFQGDLDRSLADLRRRTPVPVFWLFGKTQAGKTSIIKYLTGADEAEIGEGFRPCTRFSREYQFPNAETPVLTFLDTRGVDEPGYDPAEDIAEFDQRAHVVVVAAKALDHAQANVLTAVRRIRDARPSRPIILALTTLHEAYPTGDHVLPYPFGTSFAAPGVPEDLARSLEEQKRRFEGLADRVVPIDLTRPEDGYAPDDYGGDQLKVALLEMLPAAFRQTLLTVEMATGELRELYARHAQPIILSYASAAAAAGAVPVPFLDLVLIPGIQSQMIHHLARFYGQPLDAKRFTEIASTLGLGILVRQGVREVAKFIPVVGSLAGAALAGASTFALGKAFCYYYRSVHEGHVPNPADLRGYYEEQFAKAEAAWRRRESVGQTPPEGTPQ